jgi:hypothetical protein
MLVPCSSSHLGRRSRTEGTLAAIWFPTAAVPDVRRSRRPPFPTPRTVAVMAMRFGILRRPGLLWSSAPWPRISRPLQGTGAPGHRSGALVWPGHSARSRSSVLAMVSVTYDGSSAICAGVNLKTVQPCSTNSFCRTRSASKAAAVPWFRRPATSTTSMASSKTRSPNFRPLGRMIGELPVHPLILTRRHKACSARSGCDHGLSATATRARRAEVCPREPRAAASAASSWAWVTLRVRSAVSSRSGRSSRARSRHVRAAEVTRTRRCSTASTAGTRHRTTWSPGREIIRRRGGT